MKTNQWYQDLILQPHSFSCSIPVSLTRAKESVFAAYCNSHQSWEQKLLHDVLAVLAKCLEDLGLQFDLSSEQHGSVIDNLVHNFQSVPPKGQLFCCSPHFLLQLSNRRPLGKYLSQNCPSLENLRPGYIIIPGRRKTISGNLWW